MSIHQWAALAFTGLYTVLASAGFWRFFSQKSSTKDAEVKLILGLSHEVFHSLASVYIERGWIYREEYENLITNIYTPYKVLGGNGTVDHIMEDVNELPFRSRLVSNKRQSDK